MELGTCCFETAIVRSSAMMGGGFSWIWKLCVVICRSLLSAWSSGCGEVQLGAVCIVPGGGCLKVSRGDQWIIGVWVF